MKIKESVEPQRIPLPRVEGFNCFACGSENPIGLKMKFYMEGNIVGTDITLGKNHVGWEHMAHGGIIATLLDEVMSWAALALTREFIVTRKMETHFLRPVIVEQPINLQARILERSKKGCLVEGLLFGADGKKSARANAEMIFLTKKRIDAMPFSLKEATLNIFKEMEALTKNCDE